VILPAGRAAAGWHNASVFESGALPVDAHIGPLADTDHARVEPLTTRMYDWRFTARLRARVLARMRLAWRRC
jgi:hypothetical protein